MRISEFGGKFIEDRDVEIVEKKGWGHPDTVCDAIAEETSRQLSQIYLKKFGRILHHNVDKALLIAGKSEPKFGGGRVTQPMRFIIGGRATAEVGNTRIPVMETAINAAQQYFRSMRYLRPEHYEISADIKEGSINLKEVFEKSEKANVAVANDTSVGVGYAPISETEKIVLKAAGIINSRKYLMRKLRFKAVGEDIKIMARRERDNVKLTVAIAFVDSIIPNIKEYIRAKHAVREHLLGGLKSKYHVDVEINTLDNVYSGEEKDIYLTCTGLSAESGDDGQVGRGNRVNGLISFHRPMSLEAAAGKNINHPGKLYQILANEAAQRISEIKGVQEVNVRMESKIGRPLSQPEVDVELLSNQKVSFDVIKQDAERKVNDLLSSLHRIQTDIVHGRYGVY